MVKIALVKFESNLAVSLNWWTWKREVYKKWDKIIVNASDIIMLMRLGCKILKQREINFKEHKSLFTVTKADIEKANKEFEKIVNNKTEDQLKEFLTSIQFVEDCNEKTCTAYAKDKYDEVVTTREEKEGEEAEKKEKEEKEKAEKIAKAKEDAEKLEADKKENRIKAEAEAKKILDAKNDKKAEELEKNKKEKETLEKKEADENEAKKVEKLKAEKLEAEKLAKEKEEELKKTGK